MTTTKGPSLVAKLKSRAKAFRDYPIFTADGDPVKLIVQAEELEEAASYITELEGLGAETFRAAAEYKARAEAAEANRARLEGALRPFAERAEAFEDPSWADTDAVSLLCEDWVVDDRLTVGDLRKARAALEQTKGESGKRPPYVFHSLSACAGCGCSGDNFPAPDAKAYEVTGELYCDECAEEAIAQAQGTQR